MIWAHDSDCKVYPGLSEAFGLKNVPEVGKPFARFKLKNDQLNVTYYFPEWIKKYKKSYNLYYFSDDYELSYDYLID